MKPNPTVKQGNVSRMTKNGNRDKSGDGAGVVPSKRIALPSFSRFKKS